MIEYGIGQGLGLGTLAGAGTTGVARSGAGRRSSSDYVEASGARNGRRPGAQGETPALWVAVGKRASDAGRSPDSGRSADSGRSPDSEKEVTPEGYPHRAPPARPTEPLGEAPQACTTPAGRSGRRFGAGAAGMSRATRGAPSVSGSCETPTNGRSRGDPMSTCVAVEAGALVVAQRQAGGDRRLDRAEALAGHVAQLLRTFRAAATP
jgi:hypothetical protein